MFEPNPNRLYKFDTENLKDVAISNCPRLLQDDVVVIIGNDDIKSNKYWEKKGVSLYHVKVIKSLSKIKRHALARCTVGGVPETCLTPYFTN